MNARGLLDVLLTPGTFCSWDTEPVDVRPDPAYAADLAQAQQRTGLDESVITGEGQLLGRRVAVAASEFGFLGGSIGVAAAERLTAAVERATAERLPVIALPASGGTRMQEGTVAFVQMVKITAAVQAHRDAHLPYLVYLRNPTMGGVFASWGSLGHLTLAEPGAHIGFLGPRVYQALSGSPFPEDVQTAENLRAHGLIDAVVAPGELAAFLGRVLTAMTAQPRGSPRPGPAAPAQPAGTAGLAEPAQPAGTAGPEDPAETADPAVPRSVPAWESVLRTRRADRPGAGDLIRLAATDVVPLRQTGLIVVLARIGGDPCVLIAHDRGGPPPGPATLRLARRGARLASGLRLPLVSVIDTPGAELSVQAEQDGLAAEIARCLAGLITLPVPTVSLLFGQGAGAAALAFMPADRVLAAQHAWLAPLAPEGASAIVYRDPGRAPELAASQRIGSADLAADGIVDVVIPEPPGNAERFCRDLGHALHLALRDLAHQDDDTRLAARLRRYRHLGLPTRRLLPAPPRRSGGRMYPVARQPVGNPIVIVGGGLAGGNAAATVREEGFPGPVVILSPEPGVPFGRPPLSKTYLRSEEDLAGWYVRPAGWWAGHDVELRSGSSAVAVDTAAHTVTLDSGEELTYHKLLIATGGRNRRLTIPGADLPGIHYLRTVAECDAIKREAAPGRRAVVVGMGFIGCEVTASLTQLGVHVTAVFPGQAPLDQVLGGQVGALIAGIHHAHGVDLRPGEQVTAFAGTERVDTVVTAADRIACDFAVVGVGIQPVTPPVAVAQDNGILSDELCRASAPDVYAAGDVANQLHPLFGRVRVEHYNNAEKQGAAAARSMLGSTDPYAYLHTFWSDQYEHKIEYAGHAATWDEFVARGSLDEARLIGFYLAGGVVKAAVGLDRGGDPELDLGGEMAASARLVALRARPAPGVLADERTDLWSLS